MPRRPAPPLGRVVEGCRFRAPPAWPEREPWPPPLEQAQAVLGARRNRMRSAQALYAWACSLAQRGIDQGSTDDLVEAFAALEGIAGSENAAHFVHYRPIALLAATACMEALPHHAAAQVALRLLVRAAEAVGEGLSQVARAVGPLVRPPLVALRWSVPRFRLVANESLEGRLKAPLEGTWTGVRGALEGVGLLAPQECAVRSQAIALLPAGPVIEARPA